MTKRTRLIIGTRAVASGGGVGGCDTPPIFIRDEIQVNAS